MRKWINLLKYFDALFFQSLWCRSDISSLIPTLLSLLEIVFKALLYLYSSLTASLLSSPSPSLLLHHATCVGRRQGQTSLSFLLFLFIPMSSSSSSFLTSSFSWRWFISCHNGGGKWGGGRRKGERGRQGVTVHSSNFCKRRASRVCCRCWCWCWCLCWCWFECWRW